MRLCVAVLGALLLRICGGAEPAAVPAGPGFPGAHLIPAAGVPAPLPGPGSVPPALAQPPVAPAPGTAVPAAATTVAAVTRGPHGGTLLTTDHAHFEIVTIDGGGIEVWVTDATGSDVPLSHVALPTLRFDLAAGPTTVVLRPGEGRFQGSMDSRPDDGVTVHFDAAVGGVVLPGITATIETPLRSDATEVVAEVRPTTEAPAPQPAPEVGPLPAPEAAPTPATAAAPEPRAPRGPGSKAPASGWRPGKRGPQAQTFAPSPLPDAPAVRGNVVTTARPAPPSRSGATAQPGSGVRPR